LGRLKGAHGVVLFSSSEPDKIVAARIGNAGGVVLGLGEGENYIASDIPAIMEHTRRLIFLESKQMAIVTRQGVKVSTIDGTPIEPKISTVAWDPVAAEKGNYRHFMQKEIHEQVRALNDTLAGRVDFEEGSIRLPQLKIDPDTINQFNRIVITACGTAWHAGMVGRILLERIARIPTSVEIASEFRYADPLVDEHTIALALSQTGEQQILSQPWMKLANMVPDCGRS
jgi:glucosamine--fructose-6-phosphate aminotransferase (isomerizing)